MQSHKPHVFSMRSRGQVQPTEIHVNVETEAYVEVSRIPAGRGPRKSAALMVEGGSRKDDFDSLGDEDKDAHAMVPYGSQARLTQH